jgi:hypothetical protein
MRKPISFWLGVIALILCCLSVVLYFTSYDDLRQQTPDISILSDNKRFWLAYLAERIWRITPFAILIAFAVRFLEKPRKSVKHEQEPYA